MNNPLQPQFKIRVHLGKNVTPDTLKGTDVNVSSKGDYMDIETCVALPVTYEEQASLLSTLSFTIDKHAEVLLYYFHIGQTITFYGGYYADNERGMRRIFSGTVTRIRTNFKDSGRVECEVECMTYGFTKMGKDYRNFTYPDKNGRQFARKDSLTVEDIVRGIAEENNYEIGVIDLSPKAKKVTYNKHNIYRQKEMSDWKFLSMLAQDLECTVWISVDDNGKEALNFASWEKASNNIDDISFLFPLQGVITDVKDSEIQKFSDPAYNRPRILRELQVTEDVSAAYAVSRSAMYFDKKTGEYKESIALIEEKDGVTTMTFYELDEDRVAYIDETRPELAQKIREDGPSALPWGSPNNPANAAYYYKKSSVAYDEKHAVFDRAFFGITITGKCNMDLNIRSQRAYKVRGVLSYHSKNKETSFFLRGLKHIWDTSGTWTELDFIR